MTGFVASVGTAVARRLIALRKDRRGATAAFFGVAAIVVIGIAGLATEVGYWYNVRRDAQSAADMAAVAAAERIGYARAAGQGTANSQAQATGLYVAQRNGFTTSANQNTTSRTVSVTVTPTTVAASGSYPGSNDAVRVTIIQQEPRTISNVVSSFVGGTSSPRQPIHATAVAALQTLGDACILSLLDTLTIQGNTTLIAPDCVIASNSPNSPSCNFNGGSYQVEAARVVCFGVCNDCETAATPAGVPIPYEDNTRRPIANPFSEFDSVALPNNLFNVCPNNNPPQVATATGTANGTLAGQTYYVVCRDWDITGVVNLQPGTYYFPGTSLRVNNNATLQGPCTGNPCTLPTTLGGNGVTLAFVRDRAQNNNNARVGEVQINGGSIVNLQAPGPTASPRQPYEGVLIFRENDGGKQKNKPFSITGSADIQINGNADASRLAGGIYGSNSFIEFTGNADIAEDGCLLVVGGRIRLSGNAATGAGNCDELNPNVIERVRTTFLVE